jgi:DUF3040 family protein
VTRPGTTRPDHHIPKEAAMPLSEYERQVLDQIEHDLTDESGSSRPIH